jgi:GT2 family glycosyltransferase
MDVERERTESYPRVQSIRMKSKIISIIYVYYNTPMEIEGSIRSIKEAVGKLSHEILIINNYSPKKLPRKILASKSITVIQNKENLGFGAATNVGAGRARGKYVLVVNPDTLFHKNSINDMIREMEKDKKIGLIGPKYLDENGNISPSVSGYPMLPGAIAAFSFIDKLFPNNPYSKKYWMRNLDTEKTQKVPTVGGACMLFRKDVFDKIGGFDEQFFMYFEEADISYRVKKAGYSVVYFPKAVITHFIGRSSEDKKSIRKYFEKSRYTFFRKYHGLIPAVIGEGMIRLFNFQTLTLLLILAASLFINLYKIDSLMMFYGDFGRDLLAARDMLLTGRIPLLGIPSSVVWLHQGPLSIYLISIALFIGKFNPVAPAILYAVMGVGSTFLIYILGNRLFNEKVALLAAAFYATSPIIVMNAREPYHTAPIPFFSLLFFLVFWSVLKGRYSLVLLLFFLLGLLLQLELSNAVLFVVVGILWWYYKLPVSRSLMIRAAIGFALGIFPFILHDITNRFVQTGGLFLWIINRIRLFFGLTTSGNATTPEAGNALVTMWGELVRIIYPLSPILVGVILLAGMTIVFLKRRELLQRQKQSGFLLIVVWLAVPIIGYTIHAKPGSAYFPLLYPAVIMLVSYTGWVAAKRIPVIVAFALILMVFNGYYLLINRYFLATPASSSVPTLYGYSYGISLEVQQDVVDFIIRDANGRQFAIKGGGFLRDFATSVDNYKYLALWKGGRLSDDAQRKYIVYQDPKKIPPGKIVYKNQFIFIVRE